MTAQNQEFVSQIIRQRRTWKVLASTGIDLPTQATTEADSMVRQAVIDATFAPFHYDRKQDECVEPFRFHILWAEACRKISQQFADWFPDAKPSNKLPRMLACCGALVVVNWIPESSWQDANPKMHDIDEEHLMAAAAATQNLLLSLTAAGLGTYWSSGGQFRFPEMRSRLNIPNHEKLMAAVFVEYPTESTLDLERIPGKLHAKRSATTALIRELSTLD